LTRVWLVRHGATTAPPGVAIGSSNPPLSALGWEQARHVAAELASRPLARVLSSDLERAIATAHTVAIPHHLDVEPTASLREIDFGAWEGRSLADLWSEDPQAARAWEDDIRRTPSTFGESLADVESRVTGFWRSLGPPPDGIEIAIVAHRCILAVLRAVLTGESLEEAFTPQLDFATAMAVVAS